jgi:2-polyprenyl-3-methyl-5-hydroxy-6-metoxy-1,4-benzoquinol methylase
MRYNHDRADMVPYVPSSARRVLDVGCAAGRFAENLRERDRDIEVWGIDEWPHPEWVADPHYRRITGSYPADMPDGLTFFDCISFNDVLEHMIDPWGALEHARQILAPGGVVVASIPNVRNFVQVVRPLALNGRWRYADTGILDRTHLRFFTRESIVAMFEDAGFAIENIEPIHPHKRGRWAAMNRWLRGRLDDLLAEQFAVVGRPHPQSRPPSAGLPGNASSNLGTG